MKQKIKRSSAKSIEKHLMNFNSPTKTILKEITNKHLINGQFNFPEEITEIGDDAFYNCTNLTHIILPRKITRIGAIAFGECINLTSISLSKSIIEIGNKAFMNCFNLTHITLPKGITRIENEVFSNCVNLTYITLSEEITQIKIDAFNKCNQLRFILVSGTNEHKLEHIRNLLPDELKNKVILKCLNSIIRWQLNAKEALYKTVFSDIASIVYNKSLTFFNPQIDYDLKIKNEKLRELLTR